MKDSVRAPWRSRSADADHRKTRVDIAQNVLVLDLRLPKVLPLFLFFPLQMIKFYARSKVLQLPSRWLIADLEMNTDPEKRSGYFFAFFLIHRNQILPYPFPQTIFFLMLAEPIGAKFFPVLSFRSRIRPLIPMFLLYILRS